MADSDSFSLHTRLVDIGKRQYTDDLLSDDIVALRQHHQFVRNDEDDSTLLSKSWEIRMARKYYNRLFKEYALCDLSRYTDGKIGLRWRVEKEVVSGKGQFVCGSLSCDRNCGLISYEVPFRYRENNEVKFELVKVRACEDCARKLFYKKARSLAKSSSRSSTESTSPEQKERSRRHKSKRSNHDSDNSEKEKKRKREKLDPASKEVEPTTRTGSGAEASSNHEDIKTSTRIDDAFGMEAYFKELLF
mmetsp:Transcript_14080/g.21052  ORF Transcript_14080/g.21052 Transcript_14080/m.21052 type:complete len:247 (-) Transcript_14080:283-1023(-)